MPTVLARAGITTPDSCDGVDLVVQQQASRRLSEELYGSCMYLHYLRSGNMKYCYESISGGELCFDLATDPPSNET